METPVRLNSFPLHRAAEQKGIPIKKEEIKARAREVRELGNGELAKATQRIFPELEELREPNQATPATSLFLPLMKEVFDSGSMKDQECTVRHAGEMKTMYEKAAPILKRSSFISKVLENTEQIANGDISMGRIDLQRFRDADFSSAKNANGVRPADILINITARTIRDVLREYWLEKGIDYGSDFYEVGRYGGDELIVAFVGKTAQAEKEKVMDLVVKRLAQKDGYYRIGDTQWTEIMPILLKKDPNTKSAVEWIYLPRGENGEKIMYQEYLKKGLILNNTEFEREMKKYSVQGTFNFDLYRKDNPEGQGGISYPSTVTNTKDKVAFLSERHPELAFYFNLAHLYDAEDKGSGTPQMKRQETLLRLVENSIFDKLLGEMVYSRPHFVEHLGKNEFSALHVVDFKFLKEKNDAMTYADADNSIIALWGKIREAIPEDERSKVIISRFAGAIYIGVRKGDELSKDCQDSLATITSLPFGAGESYSVPLGHAHIHFDGDENAHLSPHQVLSRLENESDQTYYRALVQDMRESSSNDVHFIAQMMAVDVEELKKRDYQPLSKVELYALAMRGKRRDARVAKLLEYTDSETFKGDAFYSQLRDALTWETSFELRKAQLLREAIVEDIKREGIGWKPVGQ